MTTTTLSISARLAARAVLIPRLGELSFADLIDYTVGPEEVEATLATSELLRRGHTLEEIDRAMIAAVAAASAPNLPGVLVREIATGIVGMTTSGVTNRGQIGVMFEGASYSVRMDPAELSLVALS
jgi:hypothetical protein